jgi:YHS domain-containing protein
MTNQIQSHQVVDPVCGMTVNADTAAAKTSHNGVQFYFCAQGCKQAFEANPKKYAVKKRKGFWQRYLDRLNKATGGEPPACH